MSAVRRPRHSASAPRRAQALSQASASGKAFSNSMYAGRVELASSDRSPKYQVSQYASMITTAPTRAAATAFLRRRSGITSYESDRREHQRDDGVQEEHEQPRPGAECVPFGAHVGDDLTGVVRQVLGDRVVPAGRQEVHDDRHDEQQAEQR